jgi:hypothetical protein
VEFNYMPVDFQYAIPIKLTEDELKSEKVSGREQNGSYSFRLSEEADIDEKFGPGMRV